MMNEDKLKHLPESKQRTVKLMLSTISREFNKRFRKKLSARSTVRKGQIVKIILFGSHARGGYVNDYVTGYHSDYDFCVLVNHASYKHNRHWDGALEALRNLPFTSETDHSRASLVVHSYREMNAKLRDGWPFYVDIVRDGIVLYDTPDHELAAIGPMKAERRKEMSAKWYYQEIKEADKFVVMTDYAKTKGDEYQNIAAFNLHQATESLYRCLLMTMTLYAPKLHDLVKLHHLSVELVPELKDLWPMNDRKAKQAFELLVAAYVNARYSPHYKISNEQLDWLETRIKILREKVEAVCLRYLAQD